MSSVDRIERAVPHMSLASSSEVILSRPRKGALVARSKGFLLRLPLSDMSRLIAFVGIKILRRRLSVSSR